MSIFFCIGIMLVATVVTVRDLHRGMPIHFVVAKQFCIGFFGTILGYGVMVLTR
jgi:hypothetical protein